jgi:outer membrane receptor for ferrienterochelin and colicins
MAGCFLVITASLVTVTVHAQDAHDDAAADSAMLYFEMPDVVVTATRTERTLQDVPVPTEVIGQKDLAARGAMRLSDVFSEQANLNVVHEFGAGVQIQGLSSDYTLILVDGEPLIGRSGGTFDLDRLTVQGIERIEIVRGPSSSLYGSDALAGVINIITRKPSDVFRSSASATIETHRTSDVTGEMEFRGGKFGASLLLNRYGSNGYDLEPDRPGPTTPGFTTYTTSGRLDFDPDERTSVTLSGRFSREDQSTSQTVPQGGASPVNSLGDRTDWNIGLRADRRLNNTLTAKGRLYVSKYMSRLALTQEEEELLGRSELDQFYGKGEIQVDAVLGAKQMLSGGVGYVGESVDSERLGAARSTDSYYVFGQHQWFPGKFLEVITSARFDAHSDYANRLSPKIAFLLKPMSSLRARVSIGSGFRAPSFQQRYLDFVNPLGAYAVYGAVDAAASLEELEQQGLVERYNQSLELTGEIRPEYSVSINAGLDYTPTSYLTARVNVFSNYIQDMIETALVAELVDGQQVFSYFNLERVATQGLETELELGAWYGLSAAFSYQYLNAFDRDVVAAIDDGTVYKRVNGVDRRVTRSEYGGLFQRSKHSAGVRLTYQHRAGFTASVRGTYRGRYGITDRNGNLILDDDSEYVPGYSLWNVTLTQRVTHNVAIRAGVKNLFDETNAVMIPSMPGRLFFGGVVFDTSSLP